MQQPSNNRISLSLQQFYKMDPKRIKYSPATFLNLERQYLSSIMQGAYSAVLPATYRGQPMTLWNQFQSSFPAPSSLQMKVDENRILRSNASKIASSMYFCSCELCEARVDEEVTYFHSVMDEMMNMFSPEPIHVDIVDNPITTGAVYSAIARTERIVHIYADYAMLHEVDVEVPQTPKYSIVRMSDGIAEFSEYRKKRLANYVALMRMTPTRLVF